MRWLSVLSDRIFVQTAEPAQTKFKLSVARSLHFSEPVPNRNKESPLSVQYRHARNRLSFTPIWPRASIRSWHSRADRGSRAENATRKRTESDRIRSQDSEELGEATM